MKFLALVLILICAIHLASSDDVQNCVNAVVRTINVPQAVAGTLEDLINCLNICHSKPGFESCLNNCNPFLADLLAFVPATTGVKILIGAYNNVAGCYGYITTAVTWILRNIYNMVEGGVMESICQQLLNDPNNREFYDILCIVE
ncbi:5008_t:CDS:1 [Racocetra fulgida]|uniref:5008_t:CDS:1 n=1 Tax=Racocetra fulgida TaxID=60492 RepID=A0A9N9CU39_9GLOM|nr:5008_t:CDS:1 [Racocetra fulgida]